MQHGNLKHARVDVSSSTSSLASRSVHVLALYFLQSSTAWQAMTTVAKLQYRTALENTRSSQQSPTVHDTLTQDSPETHSYKHMFLSSIHCCSEMSRASEELAIDNCAASQELVQLREDKASQSQNLEALQVLSRVATFRSLCAMHCNVLHTSALCCMQAKASRKHCSVFVG